MTKRHRAFAEAMNSMLAVFRWAQLGRFGIPWILRLALTKLLAGQSRDMASTRIETCEHYLNFRHIRGLLCSSCNTKLGRYVMFETREAGWRKQRYAPTVVESP
jgi:hypothetical protein